MIAIAVHALLPSPGAEVDVSSFDSFLATNLGFPVVASFYFILLYLHVLIVVSIYGKYSEMEKRKIGLRFGFAYGIIYLVAMQEVVLSGSPFEQYGIDFILYQFFMGLGDAIPVVLVYILVAHFFLEKKANSVKRKIVELSRSQIVLRVAVIAGLIVIERILGYYVGYIDSDIQSYPVPVICWTILIGVTFGFVYILLRPIYVRQDGRVALFQLVVCSLGINWIWFNSFMGLIMKGLMGQMILRSGIDIFLIYIGMRVCETYHK